MELPSVSSPSQEYNAPLLSSQDLQKPELPPNDTSPAEVRRFLVELLVTTRDLPESEAQEIAAKWRLGTGQELRTYQTPMFRHLFGVEEGWTVFKEVKLLAQTEWLAERQANPPDNTIERWCVAFGAVITLIFAAVALFGRGEVMPGLFIGFAIGIGLLTIGAAAAVFLPPSPLPPETTVTNRLKNDYFSPAHGSTS